MTASTGLFLFCVSFCLYTMAGYPLLLAWLARRRRRPAVRKFQPRAVSVILPVRNAEQWIGPKLDCLIALDYPTELMQTIVVSDGSTDNTDEIVRQYGTQGRPVELIRVPQGGKPAALNAGLAAATGEILFMTDVRQQIEPQSLKELVACFADPSVGVVSGELVIRDGSSQESQNVGLYWRYEKWIRKQLCSIDSFHGATGCIYAMRRELARPLPPATLNDDMYLPLLAFLSGHRVIFEEKAIAFDDPTSLETEFRRKVRTLAGVYQIMWLLPGVAGPRNRMWLHFMSHKVARLLMPWALIAGFVSTFFLPSPWNALLAAAQIMAFIAAALDPVIGPKNPLKKISSPARTFLVMMAASLFAVSIFLVPPQSLWKPTRTTAARQAKHEKAG